MRKRTVNKLDGNKKHQGMAVLCVILLMVLITGLCIACTQTTGVNDTASDESDSITNIAWDTINRDIDN